MAQSEICTQGLIPKKLSSLSLNLVKLMLKEDMPSGISLWFNILCLQIGCMGGQALMMWCSLSGASELKGTS